MPYSEYDHVHNDIASIQSKLINVSNMSHSCVNSLVPVNIYAGQNTELPHVGQITKVWAGLGAELMGSHTFDVTMPAGATPVSKARLLAATFLLNTTLFAPEDQNDAAAAL